MERELVAVLGAGLTAVATGFGVEVAVGAIDRGYTLIDILSRESGPRIGANLNAMVQSLWLSWSQCGLDREVIARHADALPAILELNRPDREAFEAALEQTGGSSALASDVVGRARQSQDITRAGLDENAAFDLLERTFRAILTDRTALAETIAAVDLYIQSGLWREEAAETPAPPLPPASPAHEVTSGKYILDRLPPSASAAISAVIAANARHIPDAGRAAIEANEALIALVGTLGDLTGRARDASVPLLAAARLMSQGEFTDADRSMTVALEVLIGRATSDLAVARQMMLWSAEIHEARAKLAGILFDHRKAARHYRAAQRCFMRQDTGQLWHFLNRQAEALLVHDAHDPDDGALAEAIDALVQALALSPSPVDISELGNTRLRLAHAWLRRGKRSKRPADYIEGALAAGAAAAAFSDATHIAVLIDATMIEAGAYWHAGNATADQPALEASARCYQAAAGRIDRGTSPVVWIEATSMLGQVLLRIAMSREEPKLLPAAIEQLRAASQFAATCAIDGFDMVPTETALGRALLAEYAAGGQVLLLDLAATAFRRAIRMAGAKKDLAQKAALQHELGMTQWAIADRSGDAQAMEAAEETLASSIAAFRALGDDAARAAVEADLKLLLQPGSTAESSRGGNVRQ